MFCRFVVNQKEKYWANHSWRWASGESMAESFVSGGLQEGKITTNENKVKHRKRQSQGRSQRLIQQSLTHDWTVGAVSGYHLSPPVFFVLTKVTKSRLLFAIWDTVHCSTVTTVLCWTSSLSVCIFPQKSNTELNCSFAPNQCMFGFDLAWDSVLRYIR